MAQLPPPTNDLDSPTSGVANVLELPQLLYRLCSKIAGNRVNSEDVSKLYQLSYHFLGVPPNQLGDCEEFYLMSKVKEKLSKEFRDADGLRVEELYHKLKRSPTACRNPAAQLEFLYRLSNPTDGKSASAKVDHLQLLNNGLSSVAMHRDQPSAPSSLSSLHMNGDLALKGLQTSNKSSSFTKLPFDMAKLLPTGTIDGVHFPTASSSPRRPKPASSSHVHARPHSIHVDGTMSHHNVAEHELIREILFAFQGLNGKIITADPTNDGKFVINSPYRVPQSQAFMALRLTHLGWLFNKINRYCNYISKDKSNGHVCQSFASALQDEILEYYRLITVIEEQLHDDTVNANNYSTQDTPPKVTLHRLEVWCFDMRFRLKTLAFLVEQCRNKKGGALASVVYHNMHHGDPQMKKCITRILNQVVLPIRRMLSQWIFHGELEDNYKEFFIATNHAPVAAGRGQTSVSPGSFWYEKYIIRKEMLPGFIRKDQAEKILVTGKAISMLHQVCRNVTTFMPRYTELVKSFESTNLESLFNRRSQNDEGEFQILLETAYKEISHTSLKILKENYKLLDHFRGLRQYMLLGQGDFIRHLMDVLSIQLDKPADKMQKHTVAPKLESAIRSTNAQYDDPEILSRIDVQIATRSINELGWDVFMLHYNTKGPINTIFNEESKLLYNRLFKHLWRSKRVEYVLNVIWKNQVSYAKLSKEIPELKPAFQSFQILLSEMLHFIRQMDYYFTFDVLECEWSILQAELNNPKDVDSLIKKHNQFLENVIRRSLLDEDSHELLSQYRAICDNVLDFRSHLDNFWKAIDDEMTARRKYDAMIIEKTREGKWGIMEDEDKTEEERRMVFVSETIPKAKTKVSLLSRTYQDMVQKLLVMLADHHERELQEMSARLDFNEHYKKRDKRLETSFTFGSYKQRLSLDTSFSK